jgi:hypothetical protein
LLLSLARIHRGSLSRWDSVLHQLRPSRRTLLGPLMHHHWGSPSRTRVSLRARRWRGWWRTMDIGLRLLRRVHVWMRHELPSTWVWHRTLWPMYHHWPGASSSSITTIEPKPRPTRPILNSILCLLMRRIHGPKLRMVGYWRLLIGGYSCAV